MRYISDRDYTSKSQLVFKKRKGQKKSNSNASSDRAAVTLHMLASQPPSTTDQQQTRLDKDTSLEKLTRDDPGGATECNEGGGSSRNWCQC
jgi:hypothetical protein